MTTDFMGGYSSIKIETDVPVLMRDGTRLYADIYRPDTSDKVPVLLQRTPYNKATPAQQVGTLDPLYGPRPTASLWSSRTSGAATPLKVSSIPSSTRSMTDSTPWSGVRPNPRAAAR